MGLRSSRHIHRITIDARDNNVVFVAATGSLSGSGGDRGVFKTVDGGRTWKHVLKVDDDTGANDIVIDHLDSRVLYASTYQRRRAGQRNLEVDRRRRDMEPDHQGPARRAAGEDRRRLLPEEAEHSLRLD